VYILLVIFFSACSSKDTIANVISEPIEPIKKDILGIGKSPTPPIKPTKNPTPIQGIKVKNLESLPTNPILLELSTPSVTDEISIISSSWGMLTVWALRPGNWLWGYSALDSLSFGNLRSWRPITNQNGYTMFQNVETETCMKAYSNGVIHVKCDRNDKDQMWILIPFDNKAVQIKNAANGACLQTPTYRHTTYFSIYLTKCATTQNLDQQWYIAPPAIEIRPLFILD
ncbi:MAG: RICIN domain-containing protein, partial [Helicobacter sp.]|nr:RICIN domain-containing protein [Helicobacter sp.]